MADQPSMLLRKEAAEFLTNQGYPTSPKTLAKLASIGGGPPFRKYGRRPLYLREDLLAWADTKTSDRVGSTSELAGSSLKLVKMWSTKDCFSRGIELQEGLVRNGRFQARGTHTLQKIGFHAHKSHSAALAKARKMRELKVRTLKAMIRLIESIADPEP